jgi:hypothetical protein
MTDKDVMVQPKNITQITGFRYKSSKKLLFKWNGENNFSSFVDF